MKMFEMSGKKKAFTLVVPAFCFCLLLVGSFTRPDLVSRSVGYVCSRLSSVPAQHFPAPLSHQGELENYYQKAVRLVPPQEVEVAMERDVRLSDLKEAFHYQDENSPDVRSLFKSEEWTDAHTTNRYFLSEGEVAPVAYTPVFEGNNGVRIQTDSQKGHWVYIVSKEDFPDTYRVEFDIEYGSPIHEQLQLCFYADSLASRCRFINLFGETLVYQVVSHAYFCRSLYEIPYSMPIRERHHVCLNVSPACASFSSDGKPGMKVDISRITSEGDIAFGTNGKRKRLMLIFWNHEDSVPIDVKISDFKVFR